MGSETRTRERSARSGHLTLGAVDRFDIGLGKIIYTDIIPQLTYFVFFFRS